MRYSSNYVSQKQWLNDYVRNGREEIEKSLSIKNTIPNVSAVVFKRAALIDALHRCGKLIERLKVAGDWLLYAEILQKGDIAYVAKSLNSHRRHGESVTISSKNNEVHMAEVLYLQRRIEKISKPDSAAKAKAKSFAGHVYHYLNLNNVGEAETNLASITSNPRICEILTKLENEDPETNSE